jgi:hypothetical protein
MPVYRHNNLYTHHTQTAPSPPPHFPHPNNLTKAKTELTKSTLQLNPRKYKLEISAYTTLTAQSGVITCFMEPLKKGEHCSCIYPECNTNCDSLECMPIHTQI